MQMVDFDGFDVLDFCQQMMEEERRKNYPFDDYKWNLGSYWFDKLKASLPTNTIVINSPTLFGYEVKVNYYHPMEISFLPNSNFI